MIQSLLKRRALLQSQKENGEGGFTLIELLIVIIVLGILAAIVVFAVGTTRDDATKSACSTDVKSVQLSAEAIKTKSGSYPAGNPVEPTAGALLKSMPAGITYTFNAAQAGPPAVPAGYTITPSAAMQAAGCAVVTG